MVQFRLTYFNVRGRGEIDRLVFAAAGVDYEDKRVEFPEWPALKTSGFAPFGQLPVLEVLEGDKVVLKISQSYAIAWYIAQKYDLAGKTLDDQARVLQIVLDLEDLQIPLRTFFFEKDEAKKEELKTKYNKEQLPVFLANLEKLLVSNHGGDGFFVGEQLTVADVAFLAVIDLLKSASDTIKEYPKLSALSDRLEQHSKLAAYRANRPITPF